MYYRLILYYYTHCTFEQMGVQAICSDEHRFCSAEQMGTKKGASLLPNLHRRSLQHRIPQSRYLVIGN